MADCQVFFAFFTWNIDALFPLHAAKIRACTFLCSNIRHVTEHMRISMLSASDYNKYQYIFVSILFVSAKAVFIISSYEIWIIFIHTYVYPVIILFKRSLPATTVLWNSLSLSIVPTNLGRPSKVCQYFRQYLYTMDKSVFLCLEWHRKSMFWCKKKKKTIYKRHVCQIFYYLLSGVLVLYTNSFLEWTREIRIK